MWHILLHDYSKTRSCPRSSLFVLNSVYDPLVLTCWHGKEYFRSWASWTVDGMKKFQLLLQRNGLLKDLIFNFKLMRCFKAPNSHVSSAQLHHFFDASEQGYSQLAEIGDLLLPRPWEWGQSDWTDSLFPNTSIWPAASHTFQYFQTDFQKRELKGIGVVKTWHSQKRAAGPRDYPETSHMTQRCRNDSTARVADEGPLIDIVSLLPSSLSISVLLPLCHHALSHITWSWTEMAFSVFVWDVLV